MNRLRELREQEGMTLKEFSTKVDMSPSVLGNYERGDRKPKINVWEKLANYFNVSTAYIMGISDQKVETKSYLNDQLVNITNKYIEKTDKDDIFLNYKKLTIDRYTEFLISALNSDGLDDDAFQAFSNFTDTMKAILEDNRFESLEDFNSIQQTLNDIYKEDNYYTVEKADDFEIRRKKRLKEIYFEYQSQKQEINILLDNEFNRKIEELDLD